MPSSFYFQQSNPRNTSRAFYPPDMASDIVEHIICCDRRGGNSWKSRCDMDCDGAQAYANGYKLFYRYVHIALVVLV